MSLDLPADLESRVTVYAEQTHATPDEALRRVVEAGLESRRDADLTPAQRLIGLFSSPEDVALMEEVDKIIQEGRRYEISLERNASDVDA